MKIISSLIKNIIEHKLHLMHFYTIDEAAVVQSANASLISFKSISFFNDSISDAGILV